MAIAVAEKRKQPTKKRDDYEAPSRNGRIHHSRIIKIGIHRSLNQMVQMVLNRIQEVINEQRYRNKIFE